MARETLGFPKTMTTRERALERQKFFEAAMLELCRDSRFEHFIDAVREYRERAIEALSEGDVIKNERASLACIGEIAAYKSIISVFEEFRNRPKEEVESVD